MSKNPTIKERITALEVKVEDLMNDVSHIRQRQDWILGGLILQTLIYIALKLYLK